MLPQVSSTPCSPAGGGGHAAARGRARLQVGRRRDEDAAADRELLVRSALESASVAAWRRLPIFACAILASVSPFFTV